MTVHAPHDPRMTVPCHVLLAASVEAVPRPARGETLVVAGEHAGKRGVVSRDDKDTFPYMEPRFWPDNVRACLGGALLHGGEAEAALAVFEEDLSVPENPRNGWSLKGKVLALRALGREEEADQAEEEFDKAWQFADVDLLQPCY